MENKLEPSSVYDTLNLLDSFTGNKIPFMPSNPNNVTIYICGPTVYDDAHLGKSP